MIHNAEAREEELRSLSEAGDGLFKIALRFHRLVSAVRISRLTVMILSALLGALCLAHCASVNRSPASSAVTRDPSLRQVDGGSRYYARFSHSLSTSPAFFPIAVYFESVLSASDAATDQAAGLNTYVQLTANSDLRFVSAARMHVVLQEDEWLNSPSGRSSSANAGWSLGDEVDMTQGPHTGYQIMAKADASLPHDHRMRYANFGKGVTFWESKPEAARFVDNYQDLVSADNYWFTDDDICEASQGGTLVGHGEALTPDRCHRAANYGATVRRLRSLISPTGSKPVWAFVEVGHPASEDDWPTISPAQVRAAVWQSLIAGARGIIYFNHSFGGSNQTQHALRDRSYAPVRRIVTQTDAQIAGLARVLNAPNVVSAWRHDRGTTAMVKWWHGHLYMFAGSAGTAVTGSFSFPCVGSATATVLDEHRRIAVRGGAWRDSFADGNAVHIYRIDGGSTCGLSATRRS